MICKACRALLELLQKQPIQSKEVVHHVCTADVKSAIANGCLICRRLDAWEADEADGEADWRTVVTTEWHKSDRHLPPGVLDLQFTSTKIGAPDDPNAFGAYTGFLRLVPVDAASDRLNVPSYRPSNTVGDANALGMARMWIKTCDEQHTLCKRPPVTHDPNWRPTRLIHVGEDDTQLRLVRGQDLPDDVEYATLSHCWGKMDSRLVLKEACLESWSERLPSLGYWKTFADAVEITRRLGISHIWIDSLCIVQDSLLDWQGECPQMCNVYRRSVCNIAATSAVDDTVGCFLSRDTSLDLPLRIHFGASSNHTEPVINLTATCHTPSSLHGTFDIHKDQTWIHDISGSILNSRGWVLQERVISPRVLNFTTSQLYWECNELQASEAYPYGFPFEEYADVAFKTLSPFHLEHENRHARAMEVWGRAVRAYTVGSNFSKESFVRNLTKGSDKLVAISAVARELQPFLECEYVAGHWRKDLVRQLAWKGANGSERADTYRAPSWSWASVDAPIQDFMGLYGGVGRQGWEWKALVDVVDVEVELETEDVMGQVKAGFLQLFGKLLEVNVVQVSESRYGMRDGDEDRGIVLSDGKRTALHLLRDEERYPMATPCRLFCLPVSVTLRDDGKKVAKFGGIVLEQCEDRETYRRVGYLGPDLWHDPEDMDLADDPIIRAAYIHRDDRDGRLTIDLVDADRHIITII